MDSSPEVDPVAAVVAALGGRQGTRWIGVDGKGATGKTTLAARIAAALPGSVVVHVDDFARPDVQGWERDRFVRLLADHAEVAPVVLALRADRMGDVSAHPAMTSLWNAGGFDQGADVQAEDAYSYGLGLLLDGIERSVGGSAPSRDLPQRPDHVDE